MCLLSIRLRAQLFVNKDLHVDRTIRGNTVVINYGHSHTTRSTEVDDVGDSPCVFSTISFLVPA